MGLGEALAFCFNSPDSIVPVSVWSHVYEFALGPLSIRHHTSKNTEFNWKTQFCRPKQGKQSWSSTFSDCARLRIFALVLRIFALVLRLIALVCGMPFFNLPLVRFILHFSAGNRLHQTSSRILKESNQAYLVTCLILYVLYHVLVWLLLILSSCKWYPQCKITLSPLFLQDVQDMHITYHFQSEWPQSPRSRATWTKPTIPRSIFFCARFNKQLNKRYHFPKKGIKITFAHHFFCNKGRLRKYQKGDLC